MFLYSRCRDLVSELMVLSMNLAEQTPELNLTEEKLVAYKALKYREFLREHCKKFMHV